MAKTRAIQNNFLSGVLSPLIKGNVTLQQYYQGLQQGENVVIVPQGGVKRRGGLQYGIEPYNTLTRSTVTPTMPNGGTAANINDGNTGTSTATTTPIGTTNPYVIAQYDLGSAQQIVLADVKGISLSTGSSDEFQIQYSDDGTNWFGNYRPMSLNGTAATKRFEIDTASGTSGEPHRYWRLVRIGATDLGAAVVNLSEFNLFTNSGTLSNVMTLASSPEVGIDYLLILTDSNIQIIKYIGNALINVASLESPYASAAVENVRAATLGSVTLLFHPDYPTQRLINYGDSTVNGGVNKNPFDDYAYWYLDETPFVNVPLFDYNDSLSPSPVAEQQDATFGSFSRGMQYQVNINNILSKQITFAGDSTPDEQASTEENLRKNLQDMPVFGDTGISVNRVGANQYRITIDGESADDFNLFSGFNTTGTTSASITFTKVATGSPRREPIWSAARGYPIMGIFFEGRLWIGGTRDKPQVLLASKSGDNLNFDTGQGSDDEAIFITLSGRRLSSITDIYPGRNLLVFTSGGEYADLGTGITPSSINLRNQSSNGSLPIPVQEADGAVVFADRSGKTLREYIYTFNQDAYDSTDITVLSSHLIKTPVSMAFLTGTASDDANWLFVVNGDGTASILNKLRSQDINGFTEMNTTGTLKEVTVFGENVSFIVDRVINGVTKRFVERFTFDNLMDSSVRRVYSTATFSGLDHLEGEPVSVRADNSFIGPKTVSGGAITLTAEEIVPLTVGGSIVEVGINFPVTVQSMPMNTNIGSGENFMRLKRITRMNLRVYESVGISVDGNSIPSRSFTTTFGAQEIYTGIIDDVYPSEGWNRDTVPVISCPAPTPFHLQAIEYEVESS